MEFLVEKVETTGQDLMKAHKAITEFESKLKEKDHALEEVCKSRELELEEMKLWRERRLRLTGKEEILTLRKEKEKKIEKDERTRRDTKHETRDEWFNGITENDISRVFRARSQQHHGTLLLADFQKGLLELGMDGKAFGPPLFNAFDYHRDGIIELREALVGMVLLLSGSQEERLEFVFSMMDQDESGKISRGEIEEFLMWIARGKVTKSKVESLGSSLMSEVDLDGNGVVDYIEFMTWSGKDTVLGWIDDYHVEVLSHVEAGHPKGEEAECLNDPDGRQLDRDASLYDEENLNESSSIESEMLQLREVISHLEKKIVFTDKGVEILNEQLKETEMKFSNSAREVERLKNSSHASLSLERDYKQLAIQEAKEETSNKLLQKLMTKEEEANKAISSLDDELHRAKKNIYKLDKQLSDKEEESRMTMYRKDVELEALRKELELNQRQIRQETMQLEAHRQETELHALYQDGLNKEKEELGRKIKTLEQKLERVSQDDSMQQMVTDLEKSLRDKDEEMHDIISGKVAQAAVDGAGTSSNPMLKTIQYLKKKLADKEQEMEVTVKDLERKLAHQYRSHGAALQAP